jgi:hypothetical protein
MVIIDDLKAMAYHAWHGRPRPLEGEAGEPDTTLDALAE